LLPTTANNNSGTTMMANVKHILPIVVISCWRLLLLASCVTAVTADVQQQQQTITVHGRLQFPDKTPYNTTTKISINHGESITYSRTDGNFTLYDLTPGIYLIDVLSVNHHFSQVKCQYKPDDDVDVVENKKPALSCLEYVYPGAPKRVLDQILVIHALAEIQYFEERKSGWLMVSSMVKNPMLQMMIVMVGMMYMMPKLMEDMNPEERAQMKKQMALQQDPVKMLGEMFTGGGSSTEAGAATTAAIEGGGKKKSGKKHK
jgi:ER membrane protein complex subunit 7